MTINRILTSSALFTLAFAFLLGAADPALAASKANAEKGRITGRIVSVNTEARTIVVQEDGSKQLTSLRVREGKTIRLHNPKNVTSLAGIISFEQAMQGLHVDVEFTRPAEVASAR